MNTSADSASLLSIARRRNNTRRGIIGLNELTKVVDGTPWPEAMTWHDESIHLDHQATTPLDPRVLDEMLPWLSGAHNAHSTESAAGRRAAEAVDNAREAVAALIGCEPSEITFTSGATEANNIALHGLVAPGETFVTSTIEHPSIGEAARALEDAGSRVTFVAVDGEGLLRLDELDEALPGAALASVMLVNNEIGTIQPIAEIAAACAAADVPLHVDASQAAGRLVIPLDGIGYASISSHKLYGPQGIGALFCRSGQRRPRPLMYGGGQERGVRPGTLPVAACVGFGAAATLARDERELDQAHAQLLATTFLGALGAIDGWRLNGSAEERIPQNLNITFEGVPADALLAALPRLSLSTGSACNSRSLSTSHVLKAIGLPEDLASATIRIGTGRHNTAQEIDIAAREIVQAVHRIRSAA